MDLLAPLKHLQKRFRRPKDEAIALQQPGERQIINEPTEPLKSIYKDAGQDPDPIPAGEKIHPVTKWDERILGNNPTSPRR